MRAASDQIGIHRRSNPALAIIHPISIGLSEGGADVGSAWELTAAQLLSGSHRPTQ
jgi:hypothetical protein